MKPDQVLIALWATVFVWSAINIYLHLDGIDGNTITEVVRPHLTKHPMLALALGCLVGHTMWYR